MPDTPAQAAIHNELKPCPFCGEAPSFASRPDNADGTEWFATAACYCGGYSACAHKMAIETTQAEAAAKAVAAWNTRHEAGPTFTAQELELARTALTEFAATHRADMAGTSGAKSTATHGLLQDIESLREKLLAAQRSIFEYTTAAK